MVRYQANEDQWMLLFVTFEREFCARR
jgi:hypothetical protein